MTSVMQRRGSRATGTAKSAAGRARKPAVPGVKANPKGVAGRARGSANKSANVRAGKVNSGLARRPAKASQGLARRPTGRGR